MAKRYMAYKYLMLPTCGQISFVDRCMGCKRFVHNFLVANLDEQLEKYHNDPNYQFQRTPLISEIKKDNDFLNEVDSLALANAWTDFERGRKAWLDSVTGKRKGKKVRKPNFHKKGKCRDSYRTNNQNGTIALQGDKLKLPKIKEPLQIVLHRPLPANATIRSAVVSKDKDGKYYVTILVEVDLIADEKKPKPVEELDIVGLDMSLKDFAVSSNEQDNKEAPKYVRNYRKEEKKLARLQRQFSRKKTLKTDRTYIDRKTGEEKPVYERSKNKEKSRIKLAKASKKVANRRRDYAIKLSRYYARNYDVIVVEDIDLQAMSRCLHLGKSVTDLGFGMFRHWVEWQCEKHGSVMIKADKWFASSKTCHVCGHLNKELKLSDRSWECPVCHTVHDRDLNAAMNLRAYGYEILTTLPVGRREALLEEVANACGEGASTLRTYVAQVLSEALAIKKREERKQEKFVA